MTRSRDLAPVQEGIVDGNINSGTYGSRMKRIKGFGCAHASEVGLNTLEVASSDGYYDSDYKDVGSPSILGEVICALIWTYCQNITRNSMNTMEVLMRARVHHWHPHFVVSLILEFKITVVSSYY